MGKSVLYEGPDISAYQGIVNIKTVRNVGYKRIGIRLGYGENNVDEKYVSNAEACFHLGVAVLLYWFSYAYTADMAAAEAGYAVAQARKYWASCPIAFDFEYASVNYARKNGVNVTKQLATDMAIAFLKEVKAAGFLPVIYTNKDYLQRYFDMNRIGAELGGVYVWYARYTNALSAAELDMADVWQYTSSGNVPGVAGRVDLNRFYTDFTDDGADKPAEREPVTNINIADFQAAANADGYRDQNGERLVEDGIDGPKTQYVQRQIALKALPSSDGYQVGSRGALVRWVQMRLSEMGYDVTADGLYGKDTRAAVARFQEEYHLAVDGIAGYDTIQMLFYN